PFGRRLRRLFNEGAHDMITIKSPSSALAGIGYPADTQRGHDFLFGVKQQHIFERHVGEHVAVEDEERSFSAGEVAILSEGSGASKEMLLLGDTDPHGGALPLNKIL